MSHRPLAIVSGLTIGDYLLWNWSLNGGHDVLALVSGLSLPPLAAAFVWLVALTGARLLARRRVPGARKAARAVARTGSTAAAANTRTRGVPLARLRKGRRAAWLGELRAANGTRTANGPGTGTPPAAAASGTGARTAVQTPQAPPSQAPQHSPSKRSRSSRKIAA